MRPDFYTDGIAVRDDDGVTHFASEWHTASGVAMVRRHLRDHSSSFYVSCRSDAPSGRWETWRPDQYVSDTLRDVTCLECLVRCTVGMERW